MYISMKSYRLGLLLYSPACFLSIVNNHSFIRLKICIYDFRLKICIYDFDLITIILNKKNLFDFF